MQEFYERIPHRKLIFTAFCLVEVGFLGGSYYVWRRLKSSSDFRYTVYNSPLAIVLKTFYSVHGNSGALPAITYDADIDQWTSEGKKVRKRF